MSTLDAVTVVKIPTVVTVAAAGVQGPPGVPTSGSLSAPMLVGGVYTVTVTSNWGVDSGGNAYYDPAGAVPADAAIASLDSTGALVLTKPGPPFAPSPSDVRSLGWAFLLGASQ